MSINNKSNALTRLVIKPLAAAIILAGPCVGYASVLELPKGTYMQALGQDYVFAPEVSESQDEEKSKEAPAKTKLSQAIEDKSIQVSAASNVKHADNVPAYDDSDEAVANKRADVPELSDRQLEAMADNILAGEQLPNPKIAEQARQESMINEVVNSTAPLNPKSVRKLMRILEERRGAALTPMNSNILTKSRQCNVDISPGAAPCVVRVTPGIGAIVSFTDAHGNPWPIKFTRNFYSQAGEVTQMSEHVLSIEASNAYQRGSVGVILKGLTTPVSFVFTPGQEETDSRVDLKVPGNAPGASAVVGQISAPDVVHGNLSGFIYGGTPEGAKLLKVNAPGSASSDTRAWQSSNGRLILRTSAKVQSPGWYQSNPSMDGTTVYELPPTPVVRASIDGKIQSIKISGLKPVGTTRTASN